MISYDSTNDKSNTANKKSEQKKQHKVLLIDIRPWEEYPYFCSVYISPYKELPNIVHYHICTYWKFLRDIDVAVSLLSQKF